MKEFEIPVSVNTNYKGFDFLISLSNEVYDIEDNDLMFDFTNTRWFDANLLALFGCILQGLKDKKRSVYLRNISSTLKDIMRKNGFCKYLSGQEDWNAIEDINNTTIEYRWYESRDIINYSHDVIENILNKEDMPIMSDGFKKRLAKSFVEIFNNSFQHGNASSLVMCGQYYPNSSTKRLDISIVNVGTTIKENVINYFKNINAKEYKGNCIDWASKEGNTTKTISEGTGGLGLFEISEFINMNHGQFFICSGDEFWGQNKKGNAYFQNFNNYFNGTIVNIEFNLSDKLNYANQDEKIDINQFL